MPSEEQHDDKYQASRAYLRTHGGDDPCWDATVAFYCALHLVEKLAAREGRDNHSHVGPGSRQQFLNSHHDHYVIASPYEILFEASLLARYESLDDFEDEYDAISVKGFLIDHCLAAIETYVAEYLAPPSTP